MGTDSSSEQSKRRGFSLVESAIVLGVVGLVLGGIWLVSAKFYEDYKVNKTVEGILEIVRNTQKTVSFLDAGIIGGSQNITTSLIKAGVFPNDWVSGNVVTNLFGGNTLIMNHASDFSVRLYNVPPSACVKLTVRISSIGAMMGSRGNGSYARDSLGFISSSGTGSTLYLSDFPVSLATAKPFCGNQSASMEFGYSYTRIN